MPRATTIVGQRSLDELGQPLHQVTFCVIDLETTGGSPETCSITEIGAVKLCGGECLGTFQTLVAPGCAIPRSITALTGITESMVTPAPPVEAVLPTLLEFVGGAVIVGHNVRFDVSFLDAALRRADRPRLTNPIIDTCALARRLVREEVPDCRLHTLASRFRLPHRPTHRALHDALATADLLPALRARVRSYFSSDDRRKIGPMLREMQSLDHVVCRSTLEAGVLEARLIAQLLPRYNRRGTRWKKYVYVKLTAEAFPRLAVVRVPK